MFNWDRWVGAVEVVKVDVIDSQSRQGLVKRLTNVLRITIDESTGLSMTKTELGSEEDLVTLSGLFKPVLSSSAGGDCE